MEVPQGFSTFLGQMGIFMGRFNGINPDIMGILMNIDYIMGYLMGILTSSRDIPILYMDTN